MKPKAYSYIRYSTKRQGKEGRDSDSRQLDAALEWAEEHPEVELDTKTRDPGVSAFTGANRLQGALASFLSKVERLEIERGSYLLFEAFDRFSREHELVAFGELLKLVQAGIKVVTLVDGAVYDDTMGRDGITKAVNMMSLAHSEIEYRRKKVRRAWAKKKVKARETGKKVSKRGPAWVRWDDAKGDFVEISERADVVRRMFELAADGLGATGIARVFNAEPVPTFGTSDGWHPEYIYSTLRRRAVIGEYQPWNTEKTAGGMKRTPDGDPIPGYYPEVVDPALFNRVQAIVSQRNKQGGHKGKHGKTFTNLFLGLARCEECGGTLIVGNRPNSQQVRFLRCYAYSRHHQCDNRRRYLMDDLERRVFGVFTSTLGYEDPGPRVISELQAKRDALVVLNDKIDFLAVEAEESRAMSALLKKREAERDALEREIAELERTVAATTHPGRRSIREAFDATEAMIANAEGTDLYVLRVKMNAILRERFDWVMPIENGMLTGSRDRGFWSQGGNVGFFRIPEGTPITRAAMAALIPPGPRSLKPAA